MTIAVTCKKLLYCTFEHCYILSIELVLDMTHNVFGGTLNLALSIYQVN